MANKENKQIKQEEVKNIPNYMVLQNEHTPHAMIQIVPGELTTVIGYNTTPVLHGVMGIKRDEANNNIADCDTLFISEDPECFRQIGQAFIMAADTLHNVMNNQSDAGVEQAEATNEQ